jgi:hypothetical protein
VHERALSAATRWDWMRANPIPARLPLLDDYRSCFGSLPLEEWDVLLIRHHFGGLLRMVDAMMEDGMTVGSSWHVDIPYSTNVQVNEALRRRWTTERMPVRYDDPLGDYGRIQLLRVSMMVSRILHRPDPRPLLVVDSGAHFVRAILDLEQIGVVNRSHLAPFTAVVEQTTRGHKYLLAHEGDIRRLGIAVVSIARANTKVEVEAPFIGAAIAAAVSRFVPSQSRHIAVLGYGVIGEAVCHFLGLRFPDALITVVEQNAQARKRAADASKQRWKVSSNLDGDQPYELVLSCTGTTTFRISDCHVLAERATLTNCASAAAEIDKGGFIEAARQGGSGEVELLNEESARATGLHASLEFTVGGDRWITLLNGGFPINHAGDVVEPIPVHMIQPTYCLLWAGAQQALHSGLGVNHLAPSLDNWILENALDRL